MLNAVITLSSTQYLTVTDIEASGDQFRIFINGVAAMPAPVCANGLVPSGQQALVGGVTSVPNPATVFVAEDISAALLSSDFSSRVFVLSPGVNVITGALLNTIGPDGFDFIVISPSTIPVLEPLPLVLLSGNLFSIWLVRRRHKADIRK